MFIFARVLKSALLDGEVNATTRDLVRQVCDLLSVSSLTVEEYLSPNDSSNQLQLALLEVTQSCNCRCIHCYEGNSHQEPQNALSFDQWKTVIDQIAILGCKTLTFIGGEPSLYNKLPNLILHASQRRFSTIRICSNLMWISDELLDAVAMSGARFRFSIYGANASIHDQITHVKGSFARLLDNIRLLQNHDIPLEASVIIMKENEDTVDDISDLLLRLNISYIHMDEIRMVYGGSQQKHLVKHSRLDMTEPNFRANSTFFDKAFTNNTCWHGKIVVSTDGSVFPCEFARSTICGNINIKPLDEILAGEQIKNCWHLSFDQIETCKDCEFRFACKDCRPLGYANTGTIHGKSYRCKYDPYTGIWNTGE